MVIPVDAQRVFVFLIMEGNVSCWELELPTLLGARLQFVLVYLYFAFGMY